MMSQQLERTTFERSRAAEYFDARELQAQTGQPVENFASVALKELADNALDAVETAGAVPEIGLEAREEDGLIRLAVSDNGPGIPPETVRKVLNFSTRTSDKAAYRSPTRGAQGNALKTVLGIPHALGAEEPVIIEALGVRHVIRAWVDPAGELRIDHDEEQSSRPAGTRVSLALSVADQDFDPDYWGRAFALFNPHAFVSFRRDALGGEQANANLKSPVKNYKPTADGSFKKYRPADPTSAHWYSEQALKGLIFAHIADARGGGRDLPLGEFVRQFRGLSSPRKAKKVRAAVPGVGHLSDFEERPEDVGMLLAAMRGESKPPSHDLLGKVGERHMRDILEDAHEVREFTYRSAKGRFRSGLPYTFEVGVATTEEPGRLYTGVNFSPTFDDPLGDLDLTGPKFTARGIRGFLHDGHAEPGGRDFHAPANTAVVAHVITPAPTYLDRGKTRLQLEEAR